MPTTITASNGNVYHLWQLTCQVKDYTEDVEYTTLDNELADGYWSQVLYGSEVGVRTFNLTLPTVTDSTNDTVTGPYGETLTKRAYLRALHAYTVVEGKPFAVQSSENGQFYLVRFADRKLSLGRMMTKLYSTGLMLKQVRIEGVTIVDLNNIPGLTGHSVWWYISSHSSTRAAPPVVVVMRKWLSPRQAVTPSSKTMPSSLHIRP